MKLHEDKKLFRQAVEATAQRMKIPAVYIEKDYWVTFVLYTIFHHPIGEDTIFKGGTALSKCFGLIDRFSEDIDLVIRRRKEESNNQLTNKLRQISKVVSDILPEVEIKGVTRKMGMNRKTAHTFTKEIKGEYGQIRDVIIVEASWLGYFEPNVDIKIASLIYDTMINTGQENLITEYDLPPFELKVLKPERTICEKIMSLVRFSYTENAIEDLKIKVRHTYDLYQLLNNEELYDFFNSDEFELLLLKVANDDIASYKSNNEWLKYHPNDSKIFADIDHVWKELKSTYTGDFKNLVYGNFPDENEIYNNLLNIKERLTSIKWTIKIKKSK